jgi:indolepyruvate ferredoxin oxidoreductase
VVINELVCEGCGDCGVQSNCLSVEPLETEFGRKRQINQSTCNKDFSCVKGFCPSFVTVEGGQLRKKKGGPQGPNGPAAPCPSRSCRAGREAWGIVVAGVGGTGVITIGQLLGMAAHIEGKGIVTQDAAGLAQKGGATWSHVLIGAHQDVIRTTRVGGGVGRPGHRLRPDRGRWQGNLAAPARRAQPCGAQHQRHAHGRLREEPGLAEPGPGLRGRAGAAWAPRRWALRRRNRGHPKLMGDSIYTNPMMLGYAWQRGWVPLGLTALMRAIELNAVQVEKNKQAFEWGRRAAHDPKAMAALLVPAGAGQQVIRSRSAKRWTAWWRAASSS